MPKPKIRNEKKVRYAVVGLGHIAQVAVLPAFAHAQNSELVALISDDPEKLGQLGRRYKVKGRFSYDQFEEGLRSAAVDAVYITLPNHLHREYAERAARAGVHVLVEKPMAVTEDDCISMIRVARENDVKLMVAYRLHFEEANLRAIDLVQSGRLGDARLFDSVFTMTVKEGDIRLNPRELGGGTLYDIGIYCINAVRNLFGAEPMEVVAFSANNGDPRFLQCEESTSAILRFPGRERLASFTCSFNATDVSTYRVVGNKGELVMDPAFEYAEPLKQRMTINGRTRQRTFPKRDQFAPELVSFSECILTGAVPEPSGLEGLADVRVIRALYRSADTGQPVMLEPFSKEDRPSLDQEIRRPAVRKPQLVNTESPSE
ncbi:MAG TPA: Gfo/Idh/MocA family oxidoreductase [Gemmatimonadales bacterium]|jgi:glucose-fructose oxidoreductase|nr:Gfo/Idh/MocA family oxidoreductase [Gemmatimonadales bacterium]